MIVATHWSVGVEFVGVEFSLCGVSLEGCRLTFRLPTTEKVVHRIEMRLHTDFHRNRSDEKIYEVHNGERDT